MRSRVLTSDTTGRTIPQMSTHTHGQRRSELSATPPPWHRLYPLIPLLTVVSAGLLAAHVSFDGDTFQHCRYLGPSTRMYVTAWAAPVCALMALALLVAVRRDARRRGQGWGRLSAVAVTLLPLLLLVQLVALYWVYQPDPSGGYDCSGLLPASMAM